jgi:hypothetical protein
MEWKSATVGSNNFITILWTKVNDVKILTVRTIYDGDSSGQPYNSNKAILVFTRRRRQSEIGIRFQILSDPETVDCLKQRNAATESKASFPDVATPCKLRMTWQRG